MGLVCIQPDDVRFFKLNEVAVLGLEGHVLKVALLEVSVQLFDHLFGDAPLGDLDVGGFAFFVLFDQHLAVLPVAHPLQDDLFSGSDKLHEQLPVQLDCFPQGQLLDDGPEVYQGIRGGEQDLLQLLLNDLRSLSAAEQGKEGHAPVPGDGCAGSLVSISSVHKPRCDTAK